MVDKDKIMWLLEYYFDGGGTITISDEGHVSCTGNMILKQERKWNRLPVSFDRIDGGFVCFNNTLETLEGAPKSVGRIFSCIDNKLTTLQSAPTSVGEGFACSGNTLNTLEGLPVIQDTLSLSYSPTLPLLRCLLAKKVEFSPRLEDKTVETILNRYAGQGRRAMFDCQKELEDAGFAENARW
jgi:hypothetical protein